MKKLAPAFLLLVIFTAVPLIMAMGALQGECPADRVPATVKKISATYIDENDIVTECTEASIEGCTFLEGRRGKGNYTIDFEKIKSVAFRIANGELRGTAALRDGGDVTLVLNKDKKAYGKTRFGAFQIKLANLKRMTISQVSVPEKGSVAPK